MRRTVVEARRNGGERFEPKAVSCYVKGILWIPFALRILTGAAGILSLVFAHGKVTKTSVIHEWWQVILPCTIVSGIFCACTSVAVVLWFVGTVRVVAIQREGPRGAADTGSDGLIRLAKATLGTNGWALLVFLFFWLLGVRLQHGPSIPLIYPFTPLIVLGTVHLALATFLVEPEVDSVRSFGFGLSLLVHSTALVFTLDSGDNLVATQWAYVFIPSWLTYAWVVSLCIIRRNKILQNMLEVEGQPGEQAKARLQELRQLIKSIIGMGIWALAFCTAQVLLVLRLTLSDAHAAKIGWGAIFVPALVGWTAFIGPAVDPTVSCAQRCLIELLSLAGAQVPSEALARRSETTPLLAANP